MACELAHAQRMCPHASPPAPLLLLSVHLRDTSTASHGPWLLPSPSSRYLCSILASTSHPRKPPPRQNRPASPWLVTSTWAVMAPPTRPGNVKSPRQTLDGMMRRGVYGAALLPCRSPKEVCRSLACPAILQCYVPAIVWHITHPTAMPPVSSELNSPPTQRPPAPAFCRAQDIPGAILHGPMDVSSCYGGTS